MRQYYTANNETLYFIDRDQQVAEWIDLGEHERAVEVCVDAYARRLAGSRGGWRRNQDGTYMITKGYSGDRAAEIIRNRVYIEVVS